MCLASQSHRQGHQDLRIFSPATTTLKELLASTRSDPPPISIALLREHIYLIQDMLQGVRLRNLSLVPIRLRHLKIAQVCPAMLILCNSILGTHTMDTRIQTAEHTTNRPNIKQRSDSTPASICNARFQAAESSLSVNQNIGAYDLVMPPERIHADELAV